MPATLKIHAYNVAFGDALLLEIPDRRQTRWVLFDVGNVLSGEGGDNAPLVDAIKDIRDRTSGHIDLYIMTHEHLDHVQGLLAAKKAGVELQLERVWMTASAAPDYSRPTRRRARRRSLWRTT